MTAPSLAAWAGLAAAVWTLAFQLLLAGGAPLGALASGGQDRGRLPRAKRFASLASAFLLAAIASMFGQAAGLWRLWPEASLPWLFGLVAALFALSFVGNLASRSRPERLHGVPLTAILAIYLGLLAAF